MFTCTFCHAFTVYYKNKSLSNKTIFFFRTNNEKQNNNKKTVERKITLKILNYTKLKGSL